MGKNGWIACVIISIILLCVCICCLFIGMLGVISYQISPSLHQSIPFQPFRDFYSTPSPINTQPPSFFISPTQPAVEISPFPSQIPTHTLYTLENTTIPINDPIELAHRLQNLDDISPTVPPPITPLVMGAQETFWVSNDDQVFQVQATLRYITDHAYIWLEDGLRYRQKNLEDLGNIFEDQIYPTERAFFGSEWTPGVDSDPHIYILFARNLGDNILGYFSSADEFPTQVNKYSNTHEMFQLNADNSPLDSQSTYGTLAHEFQHMIHWYQDRNESSWMGEGFSELATLLNDFYTGGLDALYTSDPDLQLNDWPDDPQVDSTPYYGASFLFVTYFLDRFGEAATQSLVANQDNDLESVDSTLRQLNVTDPLTGKPITADDVFLDWAITNYLMDGQVGDGRFAYSTYQETPAAGPTQSFSNCPISSQDTNVHQYGVDYIRFTCLGSHILHFESHDHVRLLPQDPHSGQYAFWSNKSNESDMTLTRDFDLTGHSGPLSLNFWTWFDIEDGWDYLYLEASTDGENWQILTTPHGTAVNPQDYNYGWGYTGVSGKKSTPEWIFETVDLSQYAGQKLSLRFEYITESSVTGEGFLLDDLSIPEIGYHTDFETDIGGWIAEGWARIQNILPQSYRLALISSGVETSIRYIDLNPDGTADIPFTIGDTVDNVVLVVSGTTRFTRQLAPYRFSVVTR